MNSNERLTTSALSASADASDTDGAGAPVTAAPQTTPAESLAASATGEQIQEAIQQQKTESSLVPSPQSSSNAPEGKEEELLASEEPVEQATVGEQVSTPANEGQAQSDIAPEPAEFQTAGESDAGASQSFESPIESSDEESEADWAATPAKPIEEVSMEAPSIPEFQWYIVRVGVNRETAAADALRRRIERYGMKDYFGEIVVPTEDVVEFTKTGKKRTVKRKLFPGYIMVQMALTEDAWFLVRETPGIGDFTGGGARPTPMTADEVRRLIKPVTPEGQEQPEVRIAIPFSVGDHVRVKEGYFQNFEGDVAAIDSTNGRVTVMINIFGRSTPVELQHWQVERI
jgi:transcriptional antiterminator NusG